MTRRITGTIGGRFNLTEVDTDNTAGNSTITTEIETTISALPILSTDLVVALVGTVGTVPTTLDLSAVQIVTGGTDTLYPVKATAPVVFASIKSMVVHNKSVNTVTVYEGAANSYLPASEQITLSPGAAIQIVYPTAQVVGPTAKNIRIKSTVNASACEVYIFGA